MVPDTRSSPTVNESDTNDAFHPVINGLLGGIAGIILSFIPFSTLVGGAIAGYLEGGQPKDGLKAGAIAGAIMLIPFAFILYLLLFMLGIGGVPAGFGLMAIFILAISAVYTVGFSILGGYLGVYLKTEF